MRLCGLFFVEGDFVRCVYFSVGFVMYGRYLYAMLDDWMDELFEYK